MTTPANHQIIQYARTDRRAGVALVLLSGLCIAIALHHPEPTRSGQVFLANLAAIATESREIFAVHGALVVIMLSAMILVNWVLGSRSRESLLAAAGVEVLGLGMGAMVIAALVNGFAVPLTASMILHEAPQQAEAFQPVLLFAGMLNRVFATLAVVMSGLAALLLIVPLSKIGWSGRAAAFAGFLFAMISLGGLLGGAFTLDYFGFNITNALLFTWIAAIGASAWAANRA